MLDPSLQWQGYAPGASSASTIKITDFFDCDDSCNDEADHIPDWMSGGWAKDGVNVITLLVEDENGNAPTATTAEQWVKKHSLTSVNVCADPKNLTWISRTWRPGGFARE
jgi:hypothetical protein